MIKELQNLEKQIDKWFNKFEKETTEFHEKEKKLAKEEGRRLGAGDIPGQKDNYSDFEKEVENSYTALLQDLRGEVDKVLTHLKTDHYNVAISKLSDSIKNEEKKENEIKQILLDCEEKLEEEEQRFQEFKKHSDCYLEQEYIERKLQETEQNLQSFYKKLGRRTDDVIWHIPGWAKWILLLILGIIELAVLYSAFSYYEEPNWMILIWAAGTSVSSVVVGHVIGVFIKKKNYLAAIGLFVLIGLMLLGLAIFRMKVIDHESVVYRMARVSAMWMMFGASLLFTIIGIVLGYLDSDSEPRFYKELKKKEKLQKKLLKLKKKCNKELQKLNDEHARKIKEIERECKEKTARIEGETAALHDLLHDVMGLHDRILAKAVAFEKRIDEYYQETIGIFRTENLKIRTEPAPDYWQQELFPLEMYFAPMETLHTQYKNTLKS